MRPISGVRILTHEFEGGAQFSIYHLLIIYLFHNFVISSPSKIYSCDSDSVYVPSLQVGLTHQQSHRVLRYIFKHYSCQFLYMNESLRNYTLSVYLITVSVRQEYCTSHGDCVQVIQSGLQHGSVNNNHCYHWFISASTLRHSWS